MNRPLVSVVCLCYNHVKYVKQAIDSVLSQTYANLQLIVVDDCSTDGSVLIIQKIVDQNPQIIFIQLHQNLGNCKAFNRGWKLVTGDFIIDFSTDDVMLPNRVEKQIDFFLKLDKRVGVVFTDAVYIDAAGNSLRNHFDYLLNKKLISRIPSGDVFRDVLTRYFISGPTMIVRREVMEKLAGYDEQLAYEDFDFWVRASRDFYFSFLNEKLTKVRKLSGSMSTSQYQQGDKQLHSTYLVCEKAKDLCRSEKEIDALRRRVLYEFKHAAFSKNKTEAQHFEKLLKTLGKIPPTFYLIKAFSLLPLPWRAIRKKHQQLFYS